MAEHQPTPQEIIRTNVNAELARRELAPTTVAQRLGLSTSALHRRRKGRVAFTVEDITTLAELCDLPPEAFFRAPTLAGHR